jgi:hypothetical protein
MATDSPSTRSDTRTVGEPEDGADMSHSRERYDPSERLHLNPFDRERELPGELKEYGGRHRFRAEVPVVNSERCLRFP